jgi:hypothetical protein
MGLKYRRRQKLFPGVYLNFSRRGVSTTIGIRGFSINLGTKGVFLNRGIPGTGLYDRKKISGWDAPAISNARLSNLDQPNSSNDPYYFLPGKIEGEIKSIDANSVTSQGLSEMKEMLLAAYNERIEIVNELHQIEKGERIAGTVKFFSKIFLLGLFTKHFDEVLTEKQKYKANLQQQLSDCRVAIEIDIDDDLKARYEKLKKSFTHLSSCSKIWDQTSIERNYKHRSVGRNSITRSSTFTDTQTVDVIDTSFNALHFRNQNGGDIYIYPAFAVLLDDKSSFGIVNLAELELSYKLLLFAEEREVPHDTVAISKTWAKVNKDGTPDKRFKDNHEIPVVAYGEITFFSQTGINEVFIFSNSTKAEKFVAAYKAYVNRDSLYKISRDYISEFESATKEFIFKSSKQNSYSEFNTDIVEYHATRTLKISHDSFEIELPDGTTINGAITEKISGGDCDICLLTDEDGLISIGNQEITVHVLVPHSATFTYTLD